MCKNATSTAASLMNTVEPMIINLLTLEGLATTPDGVAAINAFNAAKTALSNWTSGSTATVVVETMNAFTAVFQTLPLPADAKGLESVILAIIESIIGVLTANSPAPAPVTTEIVSASTEEIQAAHVNTVVNDTTAKVTTLLPEFKRSIWKSASHQAKDEWNKAVAKSDTKYSVLKVA